jgi:membrane-associated protein
MPAMAVDILNAQSLLASFGTLVELGVAVVLFAETGLLVGFFLPGDALLFAAGFAAAGGIPHVHPRLALLLVAAVAGAVAGAQVGFGIGRRAGPALFDRSDSKLFKRAYVERAEHYFDRFGPGKAVVLARFIPIVRTFLNPLAGMLRMRPRSFARWQVVGGLGWTIGVTLLGYFLGGIPVLAGHIEALVVLVVAISLVPIVVEIARKRGANKRVPVTGPDREPDPR